jgi:hypothetical protein
VPIPMPYVHFHYLLFNNLLAKRIPRQQNLVIESFNGSGIFTIKFYWTNIRVNPLKMMRTEEYRHSVIGPKCVLEM